MKNIIKTYDQIRSTAAAVLAMAISEIIPKAFLLRGGKTLKGFYYDFIFPDPLVKEMFPLIEERMRQIIAGDMEIKIHEMIPKNGIEFLKAHRRTYPAAFARQFEDPLIQILQIGSHLDYIKESFLEKTGGVTAFKLLKIEERPDLKFKGSLKKVHRITGIAAPSKEELKGQKGIKSHLEWGEKLGLFKIELSRGEDLLEKVHLYWLSPGEALLHQFYEYFRTSYVKQGFDLVKTAKCDHEKLVDRGKLPTFFAEFSFPKKNEGIDPIEGLFTLENPHFGVAHTFCEEKDLEKEVEKGIKFLDKISKNFTTSYEKKKGEIQWTIKDSYGREWKGPFLTWAKKGNIYMIKQSPFPSVERVIAIILEDFEKDLSQKKELFSRMVDCES